MLLLTFAAPRAEAGPGVWTRTGPLEGGDVAVVAVNPTNPSRIFLGTRSSVEQSGVYRSVDGGESWRRVGPPELRWVERLAIHPRRGSTLYAVGEGAIYRTRDAGGTWDRLRLPGGPSFAPVNLVIDPRRPERLTAVRAVSTCSRCGEFYSLVYQSADGGDSWRLVRRLPVFVVALEVHPVNPSVLYAGGRIGLHPFRVVKSDDGGRTWDAVASGRLKGASVRAIFADPFHAETVYVATDDSLFKSDDGGLSWRQIDRDLHGAGVRSLVFRPTRPAVLFAGTTDGLFASTDGGATWRPSQRGLSGRPIGSLAVDPQAPEILYAGTEGDGLFKSADGGASWTPKNRGLALPSVLSLAVTPGAPDVILAGSDSHDGGFEASGIYRSVDGGRSWRPVNRGLPAPRLRVTILAMDPSDPATVYAVPSYYGLYKSVDGGISWRAANRGVGRGINDLAIDPQGTLYATSKGSVYKSTDGADSWRLARTGVGHAVAVDAGHPTTVYASEWEQVYRSDDGAATWTTAGGGGGDPGFQLVRDLAVDASSGDVFAATDAGAFKSIDRGVTWTLLWTLTTASVQRIVILPGSPGVLYAAVRDTGVFRSSDGGMTWTALEAGLPRDFVRDPRAVVNDIAVVADGPVKVLAGFSMVAGVCEWEE